MPRLTGNLRGAAFMVGVTLSFTMGDAVVRIAAQDMPMFQVVFLRSVLATLILGAIVWRQRERMVPISFRDGSLICWRSFAEVAAMIPFFIALANMPFANITALLQTLPLTMTLAGAAFLGEPVGWRRLTAIGIGLIGVLLIVQPGTSGFNSYSLLVLVTVAFVTFRDLSARRISHGIPVFFLAFIMSIFVMISAAFLSLRSGWAPMTPSIGGLLLAATVCIIGGYTFAPLAMRHGEIGFVTPFRYMALVWAVLIGLFVFGEWPDALTLAGASIIVATGLYTLYRERRLAA